MREACLIVKTHLGHPNATKSKEVVSGWGLGLDRFTQRWASKAGLSAWPQSTAHCSRLHPRLHPKRHVGSARAVPALGLGFQGPAFPQSPLEQEFCSLPGPAAGLGAG